MRCFILLAIVAVAKVIYLALLFSEFDILVLDHYQYGINNKLIRFKYFPLNVLRSAFLGFKNYLYRPPSRQQR